MRPGYLRCHSLTDQLSNGIFEGYGYEVLLYLKKQQNQKTEYFRCVLYEEIYYSLPLYIHLIQNLLLGF